MLVIVDKFHMPILSDLLNIAVTHNQDNFHSPLLYILRITLTLFYLNSTSSSVNVKFMGYDILVSG